MPSLREEAVIRNRLTDKMLNSLLHFINQCTIFKLKYCSTFFLHSGKDSKKRSCTILGGIAK
ncbi:hypothetical protein P5673_012146, partial [Acropora cervicornis]